MHHPCPYCTHPRTVTGDHVNPTCGGSSCQEYAFKADQLFNALGKRGKVAIALRDERFKAEFFRGADQAVCTAVIMRCEAYATKIARRRGL